MKAFLAVLAGAAVFAATPPETRVAGVTDVLHGTKIVDPYRWLEDQRSPETRAWIGAQNAYTRSVLDAIPGRAKVTARLAELLKVERYSMPVLRNGRYFFTHRLKDQDQGVLYVSEGINGRDAPLVDPNPMSVDRSVSVSLLAVTDDGKLIAYGLRRGGADETTLRLLDVDSRRELADQFPAARYSSISFKPDRSGFYYSLYTKEGTRVFYHAMGSSPAGDPEIFGKGLSIEKFVSARLTEDGRYLVFQVTQGAAADVTEIFYRDLGAQSPIRPLITGIPARFSAQFGGHTLFVHTNWKAPNGRVLAIDLADPAPEKWREVIPESKAVLESVTAAGGRLFANYLDNVNSRVKVYEADGRCVRDIAFPTLGTVSAVSGRWSSKEAFFRFNSFHVPETIYRYDTATGEQRAWAVSKVPLNSSSFELKQVWYASKDGTRIPMFLLYKHGLKLDGARPALMTGYGGFNLSRTPEFIPYAVLWAEMGGVFALPNLRGGGEFGEAWHRAGMRERKQNVFDDFIAAAEWLVANHYTNHAKLAITGRSNGGLLVGAAITERPDLFRAAICGYPLLDMVRYHRFLVARWWVPEYGSSEDPEQFKYLYAYSPYHHVKAGVKYPAVVFVTGDSDTRVAPLHARKMAALLQHATGSEKPVLLHYDVKAGHSAGMPVGKQIEDTADEMSFLLWQLGVLK